MITFNFQNPLEAKVNVDVEALDMDRLDLKRDAGQGEGGGNGIIARHTL